MSALRRVSFEPGREPVRTDASARPQACDTRSATDVHERDSIVAAIAGKADGVSGGAGLRTCSNVRLPRTSSWRKDTSAAVPDVGGAVVRRASARNRKSGSVSAIGLRRSAWDAPVSC